MYADRRDAAYMLADQLEHHSVICKADKAHLLVLSIPRGGVVVGGVIAKTLRCQHHVVVVKKIGLPGHEELAIGAMTEDGRIFLDKNTLAWCNPSPEDLRLAIARTKARVSHYVQLFRKGKPLDLKNKTIILVDDGVATGETIKAALHWLKSQDGENGPKTIVAAIPVCSPSTEPELRGLADDVVILDVPQHFAAVGQFYQHFEQVTDEEVLAILGTQETTP